MLCKGLSPTYGTMAHQVGEKGDNKLPDGPGAGRQRSFDIKEAVKWQFQYQNLQFFRLVFQHEIVFGKKSLKFYRDPICQVLVIINIVIHVDYYCSVFFFSVSLESFCWLPPP